MAAGGVGFALANILLARVLAPREFGTLSLMLALIQIAVSFGPMGLDLAINRHRLDASAALVSWTLGTSTVVAVALAVAAAQIYGMPTALSACLAVAAAGASMNSIGGALLRAREQFTLSLLLFQVHNYVLFAAAGLALWLDSESTLGPAVLIAGAYVATASFGLYAGSRRTQAVTPYPPLGILLKESLAGFGIGLAVQLLWQLERIVIPRTMSLDDLATFAAAATIAAAPFRMLQMGTQFTLVPTLRNCADRRSAVRVLRTEGLALCVAAAAATIAVLVLTPVVLTYVLQGRYQVSDTLIAAFVATGLVKVVHGFAVAVVQALGTVRTLARLHAASWAGVAVGIVLAYAGSKYGITGVVVGTGAGWLITATAASAYGIASLRLSRPEWGKTEELP